ncbi:hypothetical protein QO259_05560 [Salinicola sp. JS01]|uniref:hypothetical protein n=1 Tax=Salinicola sp. JS01 TaxID=3050071 RepID=UPI00255C1439|nr:hypothetical protein [Salinicola sp. JS01]WIX34129.1 hypothetical protein QO259_05560 [Salinicola sp. JS01]
MIIDRALQNRWLTELKDLYPERVDPELLDELYPRDSGAREHRDAQLWYLYEHGLIDLTLSPEITVGVPKILNVKATKSGIDFIEADGGLTAILGTVTVRLHADTIRDLIETRIAESDAAPAEKKRMIDKVKEMPEEGLKHLATRIIDYGLSKGPGVWQALTNFLS